LLIVALTILSVVYKQFIIDVVHYVTFKPSPAITSIAQKITLTDKGKFYFYASRPELSGRSTFNTKCVRKEANSPILGCYSTQQIFVFDVTNEKLDGIEQVTSAHELLHAVYERMPQSEKDALAPHLQRDYARLADKELIDRMKYYSKNEPGEQNNELFSILGTEFNEVSELLQQEYAKYFSNRSAIVAYHTASHAVFTSLSSRANSIASQLTSLINKINATTKQYNEAAAVVASKVASFNQKATTKGQFTSQAQFNEARSNLLAEVAALNAQRASIKLDIDRYKKLRADLEAIALESDALNRSIDSQLAPASKL